MLTGLRLERAEPLSTHFREIQALSLRCLREIQAKFLAYRTGNKVRPRGGGVGEEQRGRFGRRIGQEIEGMADHPGVALVWRRSHVTANTAVQCPRWVGYLDVIPVR